MKHFIDKMREYAFPAILIIMAVAYSYLNATVQLNEKQANLECQDLCFPIVHKVYDGECYCKPDRGTLVMKEKR